MPLTPNQQRPLDLASTKALLERTRKPEIVIEHLVSYGFTPEQAVELVREVAGKDQAQGLVITSLNELKQRKIAPRKVLIQTDSGHAVFHERSLNQGHAWRGVGKSHVLTGFYHAMSIGGKFLCFEAPEAIPVLYIEGETPNVDLQENLIHLATENENFNLVTLEDQPGLVMPKMSTQAGRDLIEEVIVRSGAKAVAFDSISSLANVDMNKEESWLEIGPWLLKLRGMGLAIHYLQHDGKGGLQRGHSKQEDFLDKSFQLKWPSGYCGVEGLKCEMTFDKARQRMRAGNKLAIEFDDGTWTFETIDDSKKEQALEMMAAGSTAREICKELKISSKTLTRFKAEAKAEAEKGMPGKLFQDQAGGNSDAPDF